MSQVQTVSPVHMITAGLRALHEPGEVFELRLFNVPKKNGYVVKTVSGYFDNVEEAAKAVLPLSGKAAIYATANPVNPALLARAHNRLVENPKQTTADVDIIGRRLILIDADPVRPSGISATDNEKAAAQPVIECVREYLAGWGWSPRLFADSGNGWHLVYTTSLPNDEETTGLLTRLLKDLGGRFDTEQATVDTTVYNAARIWKVYGTLAVKGDSVPARPHRLAHIIEHDPDSPIVTLNNLRAVASAGDRYTTAGYTPLYGEGYAAGDIEGALRGAGIDWKSKQDGKGRTVYELSKCLTSNAHNDGARVFLTTNGSEAGKVGYKCHHNSCDGKNWQDVRGLLFPEHRAMLNGRVTASVNGTGPNTAEKQPGFKLTDTGNAERFAWQHGDNVRYVTTWGRWLVYNGRYWEHDVTGQVERLTKETVQSIYLAAADASGQEKADLAARLGKWAGTSGSAAKRASMLTLAQSEEPIVITHEVLDTHKLLFNCENGTLDLEARKFTPHDRGHMITSCAPVVFDAGAACPLWTAFLKRILPADVEKFIQKAVGASLSGRNVQSLFFLYGNGANGKSTFIETLLAFFGDYAGKTAAETLLMQTYRGIPNDIAALVGKRLIVASELPAGRRLNESQVKDMTGGDSISARFLNQEFFTFKPQFKLWMYGNHKPTITGTDYGIWRRIKLVPFNVQIPENEQDQNLPEKLRAELPGILNWALEGWKLYQDEGLDPPTAVSQATAGYQKESDLLGGFLEDCTVVVEGAEVNSGALLKAYKSFSGDDEMTARKFAGAMREKGFEKTRKTAGWFWQGIGLLADETM